MCHLGICLLSAVAGGLAFLGPEWMLAEGRDARDLVDRVEPDRRLQIEAHALALHINISLSECH